MPNSNLWFITINTVDDALDFSNWLRGKQKMFKDTQGFREWLDAFRSFPLEILLNEVHYNFKDRKSADLFLLGFDAALNIRMD